MADYLLPHSDLSIIEKQEIFEIRNKMTKISASFNREKELSKCVCGQHENMEHIYECKTLSSSELITKYENIYSDNIANMKKVYVRFKSNMEKREILRNQKKEDPHVTSFGPLLSVPCIANSNG